MVEEERQTRRDTRAASRRVMLRRIFDHTALTETEFRCRYRLSNQAFQFLCEELEAKTTLRGTERMSLQHKVLCALSFYATGSYQRAVGMGKHVGQTTISKYVTEVTNALTCPDLVNSHIHFPTTTQERIDTKKKVCDSDCKIISINPKYGGATHDAFVWENSKVRQFVENLYNTGEQGWLLGDSGYPQRPWLMTPITDAAEESPEAKYNRIHGKARVLIENTFGRLKNK
ncbi:unnamed protein product [Plutella xylostella]|uniref:(diamondback moth) hypothetical protein n=1 Tax=Plutella xylostella TaxID=51655 RepID=A0A8S4F8A4_PLUXY|nr:unnamed protein product [Plutella xylostella]